MKKTHWLTIPVVLIALLLSLFALASCGDQDAQHTFADTWSKNETEHWKACTSEGHSDVTEKAAHTFDAGTVTKPATESEEGVKTLTCTVCGYQKSESIGKLTHVHTFDENAWVNTDATGHWHPATCAHTEEKDAFAPHTYDGDDDFTCNTCGYTRAAGENTVTFTIGARTYNGQAQGLVPGTDFTVRGTAKVTYKVAGADDSTYTETAPKNAGTYTVRIVVTGNALYGSVDATQNYTKTKKALTAVRVTKVFDGALTASARLTTENGVCDGDNVTVTVTTAADYTSGSNAYANAGVKTVTDATLDNGNYALPDKSEITYEITKKPLNMTSPLNREEFEAGFWQNTQIPSMRFNIAYIGDPTGLGQSQSKIEQYVLVGTDYAWQEISAEEAVKAPGNYRITTTYAEGLNYLGGTCSLGFRVKPVTEISATDTVTAQAGETKAFLVNFGSDMKFYGVGRQLGDATVTVYASDMFGMYNQELRPIGSTDTMRLSGKKLVMITANTAITSKVAFEDVTFTALIRAS